MSPMTMKDCPAANVSLVRLFILRAAYLLLILGLGATNLNALFNHAPSARGVIPSMLGGIWLLAFIGLRYPLAMLPLLLFEFSWKAIWLFVFGIQQWSAGQTPSTWPEDFQAIIVGVILMPIVIPWSYVYRRYIKQPPEPWRRAVREEQSVQVTKNPAVSGTHQ